MTPREWAAELSRKLSNSEVRQVALTVDSTERPGFRIYPGQSRPQRSIGRIDARLRA